MKCHAMVRFTRPEGGRDAWWFTRPDQGKPPQSPALFLVGQLAVYAVSFAKVHSTPKEEVA